MHDPSIRIKSSRPNNRSNPSIRYVFKNEGLEGPVKSTRGVEESYNGWFCGSREGRSVERGWVNWLLDSGSLLEGSEVKIETLVMMSDDEGGMMVKEGRKMIDR